jgi:CheY-like chemotaxis protein
MNQEAFQLNFANEAKEGRRQRLYEKTFNIAVVDDDFIVHSIVQSAIADTQWNLLTYQDGNEFITALNNQQSLDMIFLDLVMPGLNGFAVLQFLSTYSKKIPVIVLTGLSRKESVQKVMQYNVGSYLVKPIKPQGIMEKALEMLDSDF